MSLLESVTTVINEEEYANYMDGLQQMELRVNKVNSALTVIQKFVNKELRSNAVCSK